jgi:two-component system, cell cycle sensor histidine kinase and response regulator CckA
MTEMATIETLDNVTRLDGLQASSRATVLLVEDEEIVREAASEALRSAGYNVLAARNAAEAKQQFRDWERTVDLLLTDVVLPDEDGRGLAQCFQSRNGSLRVLFISGYAHQMANSSGCFEEFLAKPFSVETLLRRVAELLRDRSLFDSGVKPFKLACGAV